MAYKPKAFSWSYSQLSSYELCAKKYYETTVAKTVVEPPNAAGDYGQVAHKHFENRVVGKEIPLPLDLRHHEATLAKFVAAPGTGFGEQKLCINKDLELTGYFDNDAWCRVIIDYAKVNGSHAIIADWKFGKTKENEYDQVDLMSAVMFIAMPELKSITSLYYWAKDKKIDPQKYVRADCADIWNNFLPRVAKLEEAKRTVSFPPTPGFLCKNWCWSPTCPHKGV